MLEHVGGRNNAENEQGLVVIGEERIVGSIEH